MIEQRTGLVCFYSRIVKNVLSIRMLMADGWWWTLCVLCGKMNSFYIKFNTQHAFFLFVSIKCFVHDPTFISLKNNFKCQHWTKIKKQFDNKHLNRVKSRSRIRHQSREEKRRAKNMKRICHIIITNLCYCWIRFFSSLTNFIDIILLFSSDDVLI